MSIKLKLICNKYKYLLANIYLNNYFIVSINYLIYVYMIMSKTFKLYELLGISR